MPAALPIIMAVGTIASVGISAYGISQQSKAASASAAAQQEIARKEQEQEALRKQAMELDARRKQMENIRQMQKVRAMSLATTTSQGAAQGSGLQGAYGQESGQGNWNNLGIQQGLGFGQANFGLNSQISDQRILMAGYSGQAAQGAGLSSLGGTIMTAMPALGRLSGGFGSSPWGSSGNEYLTNIQDTTYPGYQS